MAAVQYIALKKCYTAHVNYVWRITSVLSNVQNLQVKPLLKIFYLLQSL